MYQEKPISSIEFKKNGNIPGLIKNDGAKVLVEGKAILEEFSYDFDKAKTKRSSLHRSVVMYLSLSDR